MYCPPCSTALTIMLTFIMTGVIIAAAYAALAYFRYEKAWDIRKWVVYDDVTKSDSPIPESVDPFLTLDAANVYDDGNETNHINAKFICNAIKCTGWSMKTDKQNGKFTEDVKFYNQSPDELKAAGLNNNESTLSAVTIIINKSPESTSTSTSI